MYVQYYRPFKLRSAVTIVAVDTMITSNDSQLPSGIIMLRLVASARVARTNVNPVYTCDILYS